MTTLKLMTFLDALKGRKIVVPVIQRDYAQGRDNVQAENIRKAFVRRLTEAAWGNALNLDLVYMAAQENGAEQQWIPVDGQQRLTTLFLFHLYHLKNVDGLKQFSYKVRRTSAEFCEKIVTQRSDWRKKDERPSELIRDQAWFLAAWERDPTIMGMLRTLDAIHEERKPEDFPSDDWSKNITFWVYETKEDADDEYHKLNDRGKLLTPFENLKAYIDQKFSEMTEDDETREWKKNVDGDWMDTLWSLTMKGATPDPQACDTALFTLTMTLLLLKYAEKGRPALKEGEEKKDANERWVKRIQLIESVIESPENILPSELLDEMTGATNDWQAFLVKGFKTVCQKGTPTSWVTTDWMKAPWGKREDFANKLASGSLTYADFALLYAYVVKDGEAGDWKRVIHNIVENTDISSANLDGVIGLIHTLAEAEVKGLEDFVAALENASVAKEQCKEESEKLGLIHQNEENQEDKWSALIEKAEKEPWLKGRIQFLLDQSLAQNFVNRAMFKNVLDYYIKEFKTEERRKKWLKRVIARMEKVYYSEKGDELSRLCEGCFHIDCGMVTRDDALKDWIYEEQDWDENVNLLYKNADTNDEGESQYWLPAINIAFAGEWPSTHIWRYANRVYLYNTRNYNISSAICIDKKVLWQYKLKELLGADLTTTWRKVPKEFCIDVRYKNVDFKFSTNDEIPVVQVCPEGRIIEINDEEDPIKIAERIATEMKKLVRAHSSVSGISDGGEVDSAEA